MAAFKGLYFPLKSTAKSQISLADAFGRASGTPFVGKGREAQTMSGERIFFADVRFFLEGAGSKIFGGGSFGFVTGVFF